MRAIFHTLLMLSVSATAGAHTLPGDGSLAAQLGHQLLALHHLPATALLIAAGVFLARGLSGYMNGDRSR